MIKILFSISSFALTTTTTSISSKSLQIQFPNIPACRNCIYYKPSNYYVNFESKSSQCCRFNVIKTIKNITKYDLAIKCRQDENRCGQKGKFFSKEININYKYWKHTVINCLFLIGFLKQTLLITKNLFYYLFNPIFIIVSLVIWLSSKSWRIYKIVNNNNN